MTKILTSLNGGDRGFLLNYMTSGSIGAEIGTFKGEFAQAIIDNVKLKELHLVDSWIAYPAGGKLSEAEASDGAEERRYQEVLKRFETDKHVRIWRDDSWKAAVNFEDQYFDWVYIDAGHTYEDVQKDLAAWAPKVKIGGFILGDDYNPKAWKGVVQAVDEFRTDASIETISLVQGCQFVLKKIK